MVGSSGGGDKHRNRAHVGNKDYQWHTHNITQQYSDKFVQSSQYKSKYFCRNAWMVCDITFNVYTSLPHRDKYITTFCGWNINYIAFGLISKVAFSTEASSITTMNSWHRCQLGVL